MDVYNIPEAESILIRPKSIKAGGGGGNWSNWWQKKKQNNEALLLVAEQGDL